MCGPTASCLFVLICYITAGSECSGTSTEGMPTSQTLSVRSSSSTAPVADTTSSAVGSTSSTIIQSHASSLANGEITPSSGSTPATDDMTSDSSPASGSVTSGSSPASGSMTSGSSPASGSVTSGSSPASDGVTSGSSPASGGVTSGLSPASGGVTSGLSPASGGVTSGSSPASGGVTSGSSPASGGVTSGSSPASGGVTSGSSPASGGVTSGSSPASGGVTSGSSPASGGVTSGSSPASGGVTSGSSPSSGGMTSGLSPASSGVNSDPNVTGGLMSSTSIANTAALTTTISIETSASDKQNGSTAWTMTPEVNFTLVTTSSHVNLTSTMKNAPTLTTILHANETGNATQTSTLKPPTIVTTPNNASSNLTTAGGPTSNNTLSSTPVSINVTVPVNVTALSTKVSNSSATTQSPKSSTTQPPAQCSNAKCPPGSKCVNLYKSFICRCPLGQYMQGSNCVTVRSFPGILHLSNIDFTPGMNEINSKIFSETSAKIEEEMKGFFKNDHSYYKSIVWKLEKGSVKAFVDNVFSSSSNVTEDSVNQNIRAGIQNCSNCTIVSTSDNYASESICSLHFCDANTSKCKANNGIGVCNCLPGYYKFAVSDRSCKACPSGLKLQNGACVKCPFGYGGFNCDKSYLLALVVVSCVLGGILLLLLLTLMGTCLRLRSGAYSSSAASNDYVMWPKSEMPKIPRATMHWDSNQLEMQENGSTSSLTDIHRDGGRTPEKNDDLKTFKGKQQSRYTYLCQGQENPYYVSDEKKPEYL